MAGFFVVGGRRQAVGKADAEQADGNYEISKDKQQSGEGDTVLDGCERISVKKIIVESGAGIYFDFFARKIHMRFSVSGKILLQHYLLLALLFLSALRLNQFL
jgi:hypothetical protein